MTDTWVVVADGSGARLFGTDPTFEELTPVKELKNAGHPRHHSGADSGHHAEETLFAKEIGAELTRAVQAHEVKSLVLVAPARFMGDLTASLSASVSTHVSGKVNKDFMDVERHDLAKRLRAALAENHEARP